MKRSLIVAFTVLLFTGSSFAGELPRSTFAPENGGGIEFLMPSNNVECTYIPAGGTAVYSSPDGGPELSCDRLEPSYLRFTLGSSGPAELIKNPGDQPCCGGTNYLAYGTSWSEGPFSCSSTRSGLDCQRHDGHGFFISKAKVRAY